MKKLLLAVCVISLLLTTGCGKKQLICSQSDTVEGETMKVDVIMDLDKNDKVTSAKIVYDFGSKEAADVYCELFKTGDESAVSCSGSKITINNADAMEDDEEEKVVGKTKAEVKKSAEENGFTCR